MTTDMVHSPPHYKTDSGLEAIEVIEAFFADNAHLANAFRYMSRLDKKWDGDEDLDKAIWYLQRLREFRNGGSQESESDAGDAPEKVVYEFFGRVSNVQFVSTMDTTEVDLALTPTMISGATHRIRFEISRDNGEGVADLFFGKSAQPIVPDPKYADGDKVVITEASPGYPDKDWFGFNPGDVCEFVRDGDWDGNPGHSILSRHGDEQSVPNTHFARSKQSGGVFRVWDRVRVIKNPGMTGAVTIGAIGKIQAGPDFDGDYEVKFEDDWHYFEPDEIESATKPKVGDILTITDTGGHNFPHGTQVKVDAPGEWGGVQPHRYVLCSRADGARTECGMKQQAIRLDCTNW